MMLVKDRIPYDLHNTDNDYANEGKAGMFSKRGEKEDLLETASDPEVTKTCDRETRGVLGSFRK